MMFRQLLYVVLITTLVYNDYFYILMIQEIFPVSPHKGGKGKLPQSYEFDSQTWNRHWFHNRKDRSHR